MLSKVDSIVVGLSGGADSVALLHFLKSILCESNIKLYAAHINHNLRGEESSRDELFVRELCKKWNIKLFVKQENVKKLSSKFKMGLEECGRLVRYKYFNEIAKNSSKIATAHTLSDNIETVILNLTRGCALGGLCGIPPVRGKIIRPFINVSRYEIEEYCRTNALDFVNDSTNFTCDYTRNRIRSGIISCLKKINPGLDNNFRRFFVNISEDASYLNKVSSEEFIKLDEIDGFNIEKIKKLPMSIKNRVIIKILDKFGFKSPTFSLVERVNKVIEGEMKSFTLGFNKNITVKNGNLSIFENKDKKNGIVWWSYKVQSINILTEAKKTFIIRTLNLEDFSRLAEEDSEMLRNSIDMGSIDMGTLVFRNRRPGDIFVPCGRGVTKKVKKLFNELKIPKDLRDNLPILCNENDIVWMYSIGVCEKYRVRSQTKSIGVICEE